MLCLVTFDDSDQFLTDMLGFSQASGANLSRSLPERNPYATHQWCTSCDLVSAEGDPKPITAFKNWIGFDWYTYQCTFTSPLWEYLEDDDVPIETVSGIPYRKEWLRSTILRPKLSGKNQQIPGGSFVIEGTDQPIGQTTTVLLTETRYELQWVEVPLTRALRGNIRRGLGKINLTDIEIETGDKWFAGTVLFEDVEITPRRSARGDLTSDIKFIFRRKGRGTGPTGAEIDVTWNMLPRANRQFVSVHVAGDPTQKPYQNFEFRNLFRFQEEIS